MKQHEREYLISRIRAGVCLVNIRGIDLVIKPPDALKKLQIDKVFKESYNRSYEDGIMDHDEMEEWMFDQGLWVYEDQKALDDLAKDIETLKLEMYNNRSKVSIRESARQYLRTAERAQDEAVNRKTFHIPHTCEGIARTDQFRELCRICTYKDDKLYDFSEISVDEVVAEYHTHTLTEKQIRDLAREEPWRSLWAIREAASIQLFYNYDKELTSDQKNLCIWSIMYDNIQESAEPPPEEVIEDDDVLDGWFIFHRKKREREKLENEFENKTSANISNKNEVFVMTQSDKEVEQVNSMNPLYAQQTKKRRYKELQQKGKLEQHQFRDQQLILQQMSNQQYKDKFRS